MYQLIRLGNCIHVFDRQNSRFVKGSFTNFRQAVGAKPGQSTRNEILRSVKWVQCSDPECRFHKCRQNGHRVAVQIK